MSIRESAKAKREVGRRGWETRGKRVRKIGTRGNIRPSMFKSVGWSAAADDFDGFFRAEVSFRHERRHWSALVGVTFPRDDALFPKMESSFKILSWIDHSSCPEEFILSPLPSLSPYLRYMHPAVALCGVSGPPPRR